MEAFFIFCEGAHDVAFVKLILNKLLNYEKKEMKFSEMPYPLDNILKKAMETHSFKDMSLDMAHNFFLPNVLFKKQDKLVCVFNCVSKSLIYEKVDSFLPKYDKMLKKGKAFAKNYTIDFTKYLFIYDADDGIGSIENDTKEKYQEYGNIEVFIFQDKKSGFGTLEDIILPMLESVKPNILKKAKDAMENTFEWDIESDKKEIAIAEKAKLKKAIITTAGQREKPGSSMNVIIEQADFLTKDILEKYEQVIEFKSFLEKNGI